MIRWISTVLPYVWGVISTILGLAFIAAAIVSVLRHFELKVGLIVLLVIFGIMELAIGIWIFLGRFKMDDK